MSGGGPPEGRNPFEGLPMFGDLARLFSGQGPVNWDVARQTARWLATDGKPEVNVDPLERIRMEELLRVADLQVSEFTGLATSITGGVLSILPVTRGDWAVHTLDAYRSLLERLGRTVAAASSETVEPDPQTQLLGDLGSVLAPVLLGVQSGYMVGQIGRQALGQHDPPLPRPAADQLLVVGANVSAFAEEWSLPAEDVRMWVCLSEVTRHTVMGRPHVRARLLSLIESYIDNFEVDPSAVEASISELDPTDPNAFKAVLGNPEVLLGAIQTDAQQTVVERIDAILAAVEGYADHVVDSVGAGLITSYDRITEALQRHRAEAGEGQRFAARLLGVQLSRRTSERGAAFIDGVVERAGDDGLRRLWQSERDLPTPAEIEAPGLWLARIDLPD